MARWDLGTKFPHSAIPPTSSTSLLPGKGEFQLTGCCADAGLHPAPCSQWVRGLCASSERPPRWTGAHRGQEPWGQAATATSRATHAATTIPCRLSVSVHVQVFFYGFYFRFWCRGVKLTVLRMHFLYLLTISSCKDNLPPAAISPAGASVTRIFRSLL